MKKIKTKLLKSLPYIIISILVGVTAVYAAPSINKLTPSGNSVTDQMYSLTDIWNLATDGTPAPEKTGEVTDTPDIVSNTGRTLTEVYNALSSEIAKLTPDILVSGNTVFGVEGTATTGSSPTLTWQTNPNIDLCWSHNTYEINNGCAVGNGFTTTPDENTTLGAVEYCQYLESDGETLANTAQNIWHLPTIQEYQSITDYTLYNNATEVPGFAEDAGYWSGTEYAGSGGFAWLWGSWDGFTNGSNKNYRYAVRCARLAL